jgi:DNA polymerase III delta prime subunit
MQQQVWMEKYRPSLLRDVVMDEEQRRMFEASIATGRCPHWLLEGSPGTGKTTTAHAFVRGYQRRWQEFENRQGVLHFNASDDRGVDVVRTTIATFVANAPVFHGFDLAGGGGRRRRQRPANSDAYGGDADGSDGTEQDRKFVVLDEVDNMTRPAQHALRYLLESGFAHNTRFVLICNYAHRLDPSLVNQCVHVRFHRLPAPAVRALLREIVSAEGLPLDSDADIEALRHRFGGSDVRSMINQLQFCPPAAGAAGAGAVAVAPMLNDAHLDFVDDAVAARMSAPEFNDAAHALNMDPRDLWRAWFARHVARRRQTLEQVRVFRTVFLANADDLTPPDYSEYLLASL